MRETAKNDKPTDESPEQTSATASDTSSATSSTSSSTSSSNRGDKDRQPDSSGAANPLRGSRTSGFWAAVVGFGVVLVLLIIFISQNTRETTVTFLVWEGRAPVSVALLIATAAGLFLATAAGSLRILQLRRRVKRSR
jgi:uncharacterized integral membrane protein